MQTFKRSIEINVPVKRVFDFITHPENLPSVWPNMVGVSNLSRKPDGSADFDWVYKMAGLHFRGHCNAVVVKPYEYVEAKNTGDIPSTFRWSYSSRSGGGMKLIVEVEYTLPLPVIGKIAEAVLLRLNERDAENMLENIKTTLETTQPQPSASASI